MYFSGIQPTGDITLGNISILDYWKELDKEKNCRWMIADLHAISLKNVDVSKDIENIYKFLRVIGINKENIYLQSLVPEHVFLFWKLHSLVGKGELERMTQWKDKKGKQDIMGLLSYPILMASDIILNNPLYIPVGKDQIQHLEFTNEIIKKINSRGCYLNIPKPLFRGKEAPKIRDLKNPEKKMSKTGPDKGKVCLFDSKREVQEKILKATTDSLGQIKRGNSVGMDNLFDIFQLFQKVSDKEIETEYSDGDYARFKRDISVIVSYNLENIKRDMKKISNWKKDLYSSTSDIRKRLIIPDWEG